MGFHRVGLGVEGPAGGAAFHLVHDEVLGRILVRRRIDHAEPLLSGFLVVPFLGEKEKVEDVETEDEKKDAKHGEGSKLPERFVGIPTQIESKQGNHFFVVGQMIEDRLDLHSLHGMDQVRRDFG